MEKVKFESQTGEVDRSSGRDGIVEEKRKRNRISRTRKLFWQ